MSDRLLLYPQENELSISVWNIDEDRYAGELVGHTSPIGHADIARDVALTIADGEAFAVKIWSMDTFQCTADLNLPGLSPHSACLLEDRLLLGNDDGSIKVWDIGGGAPVPLLELKGHGDKVLSTDASLVTSLAVSGCRDGTIRLWDLRTGQCVRAMDRGHAGGVLSVSMDLSGVLAVSGSWDQTVKVWDLGNGDYTHTFEHHQCVHDVMMDMTGSSFLTVSENLLFKAWNFTFGCDEKPILDANLSSQCIWNSPLRGAVSRDDLSKVAVCYFRADGKTLGVDVWK